MKKQEAIEERARIQKLMETETREGHLYNMERRIGDLNQFCINVDEMKEEHEAWQDIFNEMERLFEVNRAELNNPKYRNLFCLIERWAWLDRERRTTLKDPEDFVGCLWNGEDIVVRTD